jgi:hypothetical protein
MIDDKTTLENMRLLQLFARKSKGPTLDEALAGNEFGNDAEFLACVARMAADNPHQRLDAIVFVAENIWRMQLKCVAALGEIKREAAIEERSRIAAIIGHGVNSGDLQSALNLAFSSELSAADAIEIMNAKKSAEPIRPN